MAGMAEDGFALNGVARTEVAFLSLNGSSRCRGLSIARLHVFSTYMGCWELGVGTDRADMAFTTMAYTATERCEAVNMCMCVRGGQSMRLSANVHENLESMYTHVGSVGFQVWISRPRP